MSKKANFFWASYADLMTSLFFIMLVLFVITVAILVKQSKATRDQLNSIINIQKSIENIDSKYFSYNKKYKKHILNINIQYPENYQFDPKLLPVGQKDSLIYAGRSIVNFIEKNSDNDVGYLVIIEGQASNDKFNKTKLDNNDVLSYNRALWLNKFWIENGINILDQPNCELIISGSGIKGVPRIQPDIPPANRRFLIHIIPKFGKISSK